MKQRRAGAIFGREPDITGYSPKTRYKDGTEKPSGDLIRYGHSGMQGYLGSGGSENLANGKNLIQV